MWDEHERFARRFVPLLAWGAALLIVATAAASLALDMPGLPWAVMAYLVSLASVWLVFLLIAVGVAAVVGGVKWVLRSLRSRHDDGPRLHPLQPMAPPIAARLRTAGTDLPSRSH